MRDSASSTAERELHSRWSGNPSGAANFIASVAQCIERRASDAEVAGETAAPAAMQFALRYLLKGASRRAFLPEAPFPCVVQQQRHSAQNGASAGANPAAGTILHISVAQEKSRRLLTGSSKVRLLPGMPILARYSHVECCARATFGADSTLESRATSQWNANRPSEPGPVANGIVPPAKRHGVQVLCVPPFHTTLSSSETGHLTFNQKTRGQFPAGWPLSIHTTASSNSLGLCALHTGIRVQLPVRLPPPA